MLDYMGWWAPLWWRVSEPVCCSTCREVVGDEVSDVLRWIIVVRARVALAREMVEHVHDGALEHGLAVGQQNQVVEQREDGGARLMHGAHHLPGSGNKATSGP